MSQPLDRRTFCTGACGGLAALALPACSGGGLGWLAPDGGSSSDLSGSPGSGDLATTLPRDLSSVGSDDLATAQGSDLATRSQTDLATRQQTDLATQHPSDLARPPDLAMACGGGFVDYGPAAGYPVNSATHFVDNQGNPFFICRDAKGLYAQSAICTHAGCTVSFGNAQFHCPCHGSLFNFNGVVLGGPAPSPLGHFAVCVSGGTVYVDTNIVVPPATRV
jgi:Rieske Fe-S protein